MCQKASYLVYQQNDYLVYQPVYHTCAKVNEMYQNSLGMMHCPVYLTLILSLVYQNATGVPNVTTVTNVPKVTKNDPSVPVFGSAHFYMGF